MIGTDGTQARINLQTLTKIRGRQSFPETYEPFLGMILAEQTTISNIISKGDEWFEGQKNLKPFMVNSNEAKLISEDAIFIQANCEKVQDRINE